MSGMGPWYILRGGCLKEGPYTPEQLRRSAQRGLLTPDTLLWRDGLKQPEQARRFRELFPKVHASDHSELLAAAQRVLPTCAESIDRVTDLFEGHRGVVEITRDLAVMALECHPQLLERPDSPLAEKPTTLVGNLLKAFIRDQSLFTATQFSAGDLVALIRATRLKTGETGVWAWSLLGSPMSLHHLQLYAMGTGIQHDAELRALLSKYCAALVELSAFSADERTNVRHRLERWIGSDMPFCNVRAQPSRITNTLAPCGGKHAELAVSVVTSTEYEVFLHQIEQLFPQFVNAVHRVLAKVFVNSAVTFTARDQIQRDLVFIAARICNADGVFRASESLVLADVMSVLISNQKSRLFLASPQTDFGGVLSSVESLIEVLQAADMTRLPGWQWSFDGSCMSVQYLAQYDIWNGTTYALDFIALATRFCEMLTKADTTIGKEEKREQDQIFRWLERSYQEMDDSLQGGSPFVGVKTTKAPEESLNDLLAHLHSLTGLATVKNEVDDLVAFLKVQGIRKDRGMAPASISRHLVFYGNPGTGKTTVARLLSKIYASLGFLSKGHLVEADRSGMVAGFVGQTALKTREVCAKALGGVLFIDEAYALVGKDNDFGQEAIDTLLKFMEDNRDDLVVVVAGYPDKMVGFLNSNPGIRSRFTRFMNFQDYSPEELSSIFAGFCKDGGFALKEDAKAKARGIFEEQFLQRDETFGNARFARNLFEQCLVRHARRITKADHITDGMLTTLEEDDLEWVG
jgi:hypothetical protein